MTRSRVEKQIIFFRDAAFDNGFGSIRGQRAQLTRNKNELKSRGESERASDANVMEILFSLFRRKSKLLEWLAC